MKVLHIISDWKWTGPAEPVVSLCEALISQGVEVQVAYRKTPFDFPERTIEKEVKKRGIPFYEGFRLNRYFSIGDWVYDIFEISEYCKRSKIDICHTHLSHDHFISFLSLYFAPEKPLLIRTDHKRDGIKRDFFTSFVLKRTDGLVTFSERIAQQAVLNFKLSPEKVCVIPPGVSFNFGNVRDLREEFGIKPDDKVLGVVGRLKTDRGYDIILKAYKIVRDIYPNAKLLILGRSSQIERSILKPAKELGLKEGVILAGYRVEDYYSVINCFDIFVMMRAGSDGTGRALREVMAMGKPAIVSDMGMLPEMIKEGETGFIVPPNEKALAEKIMILIGNEELRRKMGENAKRYAKDNWSYIRQARFLIDFYERLLSEKAKNSNCS